MLVLDWLRRSRVKVFVSRCSYFNRQVCVFSSKQIGAETFLKNNGGRIIEQWNRGWGINDWRTYRIERAYERKRRRRTGRRWCLHSGALRCGDSECGLSTVDLRLIRCCSDLCSFRRCSDLRSGGVPVNARFRFKLTSEGRSSHWFVLFLSSRRNCRCPTDARRSSDVEVPTECLDPLAEDAHLLTDREHENIKQIIITH